MIEKEKLLYSDLKDILTLWGCRYWISYCSDLSYYNSKRKYYNIATHTEISGKFFRFRHWFESILYNVGLSLQQVLGQQPDVCESFVVGEVKWTSERYTARVRIVLQIRRPVIRSVTSVRSGFSLFRDNLEHIASSLINFNSKIMETNLFVKFL